MNNELNVFDSLAKIGVKQGELPVMLSSDLVRLLSRQLYRNPSKAIEELVINSYDAEAQTCRIHVPKYYNQAGVIFDDGTGMDEQGLRDLWHIGRSKKRSEEIEERGGRKQVGKFGIGKLAVNAIANKLTYISRTKVGILGVSIDFHIFEKEKDASDKPIFLPVVGFPDFEILARDDLFKANCQLVGVSPTALLRRNRKKPWTLAIIEDFEDKFKELKHGRLRWILSTAIPLESKFKVYLNKAEIKSAKIRFPKVVEFSVSDLPEEALPRLKKKTGEEWLIIDSSIVSDKSFKDGIRGVVYMTERSLEGKSTDIGRSHGFFIHVRGRLINENDPVFGILASRLDMFNKFYARIDVDGLDDSILISRDEVELASKASIALRALLQEIYKEAKVRYERTKNLRQEKQSEKREGERQFVEPSLIESPIADILIGRGVSEEGAGIPDESAEGPEDFLLSGFLYMETPPESDLTGVAENLALGKKRPFKYEYRSLGREAKIVKFNPATGIFAINEDHEFTAAHADDHRSKVVLEDLATAEVMLEVHLRRSRMDNATVTDILEKRDILLRSLAKDHPHSLKAVAKFLEDSASNERELEFSLVAAARAVGFDARHISGAGEPDGLATLKYYPKGEIKLTLEAKSSQDEPGLGSLDFAGLSEHVSRHGADGCLLVAPTYPGRTRKNDSAASYRANESKISCWTIKQLARFLRAAEENRLTARDVAQIVLCRYTPDKVETALDDLIGGHEWSQRELQHAVADAILSLEDRLSSSQRTVDIIAVEVSRIERFSGVEVSHVKDALQDISVMSHGGLILSRNIVKLKISPYELVRRVSPTSVGSLRQGERFRLWEVGK